MAEEDTSIGDMLDIMTNENVHHIPVLRGKKVVGMVSRHDLLNIFIAGK